MKGGNFVETMLRLARERGQLKVVDEQVMSPTATADVARVLSIVVSEGYCAGTYHVVNSGAVSWYEFAREITRQAHVPVDMTPCSTEASRTRAARPKYSALDNGKLAGVTEKMSIWEDALERYLVACGLENSRAG